MSSDPKLHRKLKVWQAGMDLVAELYKELEKFPAAEKFGLVAQLQRAAVSIPSNIAEGAARRNTNELVQFLYVAGGSLSDWTLNWKSACGWDTWKRQCIIASQAS